MTIEIDREARQQAIASIERYFQENMEERIGNIAAGSNCTGVVVGSSQIPADVSNSRYDRPKVSPVKKPRERSSQMQW